MTMQRAALIAAVRQLWDSGLSTKLIGARLGVTKNVVIGIAHRANLPPRESPILLSPRTPRAPRAKPLQPGATTLPPVQEPTREELLALPPRPAPAGGRGCRMPLWSARERPSHRYCDAPIARGSWCAACARKVFSERAA